MSNITVVQTKDKIFMGSDSAVSATVDNQIYRVNVDGEKLFPVDNFLIFCSGLLKISYAIIDEFKKQKKRDIGTLSDIAKTIYYLHDHKNEADLEILVGTFDNHRSVIYQISPYNNFNVLIKVVDDGIGIWTGGIKTKEAYKIMSNEIFLGNSVGDSFVKTFNNISFEGIGGTLSVYKIDGNGINKVLNQKIVEKKNLQTIFDFNFFALHCVFAERLIGQVVASSNLQVTNSSGTVSIDANGINVTNMTLTLKRSDNKSRILLDSSNGIKIQSSPDGTTWTDKLYADTSGNLVATSLTTDKLIIKNGSNVLIDANTNTIDFSKFTTKIGTLSAANIDATNLHVSSANIDGTITAGAVVAGISLSAPTITGGLIQTQPSGTYPRTVMSTSSNLFGAYRTATNYVTMETNYGGLTSPSVVFVNGIESTTLDMGSSTFNISSTKDVTFSQISGFVRVLGNLQVNGSATIAGDTIATQPWVLSQTFYAKFA